MLRRNPYASKAQHRLFRMLEARGELPRGTASRWMHETPRFSRLPEHVSGFGSVASQLAMGRKVEREHKGTVAFLKTYPDTPPEKAYEMIAKEHIREIADYYTRLKKMEAEARGAARVGYYSFGQDAPAQPASEAAPEPAPALQETFWQRHGAEIIVGTISAVTGALAVYYAMRLVEPSKLTA